MTTTTLRKFLMMFALSGGLMSTGCDMIDKLKGGKKDDTSSSKKKKSSDDDDDDDDDSKKKPSASASATASAAPTASATAEPSAAPSASAATPPPATDDVTHYPNEIPQSGTFITKKSFTIYQAADTTSKELGHLAPGTVIELKASYQNWMLINWPSGIGELSPGWVQLGIHDPTISATTQPVDAGKPVDAGIVDAGVVDAGKTPVVVDAGKTGRPPVVRVPLPVHH